MPFFSTIIPTYNRATLIAATLDSVLAQDFKDQEIIVVDDGSTDGTLEILQRYEPRIRVLRQQNQGPGVARNLAAQQATGAYMVFLDSDDLWFPWTLSTYAQIIAQTDQPAFICGQLVLFGHEIELKAQTQTPLKFDRFDDYFASSRQGLYCGAGQSCVRRDIFLAAGGYTSRRINGEDHDFAMRLGTAKGFIKVIEPVLLGYRKHTGAVTLDPAKNFEGKAFLLEQEKSGKYPGGNARRTDRRRILAGHVRSSSIALLRQGHRTEAWRLFRDTFNWQLQLGRIKYLAAFLGIALTRRLRAR